MFIFIMKKRLRELYKKMLFLREYMKKYLIFAYV